ncbi:glycosyltransferase family 4 protein [Agreia sp. PsM10]|uniref:glycosyltransferase family 4 protein n=1 Tax=Agreia sp. PsM10 TaxID=3030533 RepID=UPI00263A8C0C|nr:glycosyltransferase family 4 protein [Agreia sp. PsM10]MDN4641336.1 glycosyltransferase family 4 protein [Agreia sp. PsM10]
MADEGVLAQYWTSAQVGNQANDSLWLGALPKSIRNEFNSRQLPISIRGPLLKRAAIARDLAAAIARRIGNSDLERRLLHARNRAIAKKIIGQLKMRGEEDLWVIIPSNTHSGLARQCIRLGVPYALYTPLPLADYSSNLMAEEAVSNPDWARHLHFIAGDPLAADRDAAIEAKGASLVLANSAFTGKSFATLVDQERIASIPLAVDIERFRALGLLGSATDERKATEPLKVTYSGHISQRKGLSYLFEAIEGSSHPENYELLLIGSDTTQMESQLRGTYPHVRATFVRSLPQESLWRRLASQHVFVFPTLLDGFGNVLIEASALGLPSIVTDRCGGLDIGLVPDGGSLVPAQDGGSIRDALQNLYAAEDERRLMGIAATAVVARGRSWADYGADVLKALTQGTPLDQIEAALSNE